MCKACKTAGVDPQAIGNMPAPIRPTLPKVRASRSTDASKHAAALAGRFVKISMPRKSGRGAPKHYYGKVFFRGASYSPTFFSVTFQDGLKEVYTEKELKPMLLPASTKLPKNVVLCILWSEAEVQASQPWDLHPPAGLQQVLQRLMPGTHEDEWVARLAAQVITPNTHAGVAHKGDVSALCQAVDLTHVGSIHDPWAGQGMYSVQEVLGYGQCMHVLTNGLCTTMDSAPPCTC